MNQCENDNCDNCDNDCDSGVLMDGNAGVRTVFLEQAPEGAYSPEFAAYVASVWPEEDEFQMSIETALLITKWVLSQDEPHIAEETMDILNMMIVVALDAVEAEQLADLLMRYGLTVNSDGMLAIEE